MTLLLLIFLMRSVDDYQPCGARKYKRSYAVLWLDKRFLSSYFGFIIFESFDKRSFDKNPRKNEMTQTFNILACQRL